MNILEWYFKKHPQEDTPPQKEEENWTLIPEDI
jgi:hypothetical protein